VVAVEPVAPAVTAAPLRAARAVLVPAAPTAAPELRSAAPTSAWAEVASPDVVSVAALPGLSVQRAAELSGPVAVALSGLPPVEHEVFRLRAAVSEAGSPARPGSPGDPRAPAPAVPGGPVAAVDAGSAGNGAGSAGSAGNGGMPHAVLVDPDSAPPVFALSVLTAPERRITWWYPEVVVGPG
jgi:hypothetical protein